MVGEPQHRQRTITALVAIEEIAHGISIVLRLALGVQCRIAPWILAHLLVSLLPTPFKGALTARADNCHK